MCPYGRCSKTFGRWRMAPRRKPTATSSISAARQRRSLRPMCWRVNRSQSSFHPRASRYSGPPRSTWYFSSSSHIRASASRSATRATRMRESSDARPATSLPRPHPRWPRSRRSLALENGFAFLEEGAETLLRIGHREEAILQFAFEREAFVHRHLGPFRHGPFDESHRARGVLRIRQALRKGHRLLPELRSREDAVEEAPVERFFRGEHAPGRHEVDGPALPDQPRETLRPSGPGQDAERHFGQTNPPGAVRSQPEIRRHGDLESASDAVPVDGSDEELRRALHLVQRLLAVQTEHGLVVRRRRREEVDVRARGPYAIELRRDDAHVDVVIESYVIDHRVQVAHQVGVVRVRLRLVQPRDRDPVLLLQRNVREVHRSASGQLMDHRLLNGRASQRESLGHASWL